MILDNPIDVALAATAASALAFLALAALYFAVRPWGVRRTEAYLSGEGERVVSNLSPSVGALYWGFIRRFARELYEVLLGKVHTGSLHDWYRFISSWLAILLLLAVVVWAISVALGWL